MEELERLIRKFWNDETGSAENKRLLELLEEHKEAYRESVRDDFSGMEPVRSERLGARRAAHLLRKIHRELDADRRTTIRQWVGIAASLIVMAGVAVFAGWHKEKADRVGPLRQFGVSKPGEQVGPRLTRVFNSSREEMEVHLKDGSLVRLERNSSISYFEPFVDGRRDIRLTGNALFTVAKDKEKPFAVYAGGVVTRVLGTKFRVYATDSRKVRIQLLEGRVAVGRDSASGPGVKGVYLRPGQEVCIDHSNRFLVRPFAMGGNNRAGSAANAGSEVVLDFHQESLDSVFKLIGERFHVAISFHPRDMEGLFFTGSFLRSDDLTLIISTICHVNELQFVKEQDSIVIEKSH